MGLPGKRGNHMDKMPDILSNDGMKPNEASNMRWVITRDKHQEDKEYTCWLVETYENDKLISATSFK